MAAANLAAKQAETLLGHGDQNRATHTDISNPDREGGEYADQSGEKMKALVWMGKNDVRVGVQEPSHRVLVFSLGCFFECELSVLTMVSRN